MVNRIKKSAIANASPSPSSSSSNTLTIAALRPGDRVVAIDGELRRMDKTIISEPTMFSASLLEAIHSNPFLFFVCLFVCLFV